MTLHADDSRSDSGTSDSAPWMCHVCGTASRGEGVVCEICFRTTCPTHLRRTSIYNRASGLYEFTSVCMNCALAEIL